MSNSGLDDKAAIDHVAETFYRAFTNCEGAVPRVDSLYELFIPRAIIVKNVHATAEVYDVAAFAEPRRTILTDGTLTEFSEKEVSERTDIFGNVAQRFSRYEKSWIASGKAIRGGGTKTIQFVRTQHGWRISALSWDDDPD